MYDFDLRQPPIHKRSQCDLANQDDFLERAIWFSVSVHVRERTWPRPRIRDVLLQLCPLRFQNTLAMRSSWRRLRPDSHFYLLLIESKSSNSIVKVSDSAPRFVFVRPESGILRFFLGGGHIWLSRVAFFLRLSRVSAFTHCLLIENQEEFQVFIVFLLHNYWIGNLRWNAWNMLYCDTKAFFLELIQIFCSYIIKIVGAVNIKFK